MDWYKEFNQSAFLEAIVSGKVEDEALALLNMDREPKNWFRDIHLSNIQAKDPKFREALDEAKRKRADTWFGGIAKSVSKEIDKEQVGVEKLKFEQRKYLASIDNPERYGEKRHQSVDIRIDINAELKSLTNAEVKKIMESADPFAIEAESKVVSGFEHGGFVDYEGNPVKSDAEEILE